MATDFHDDECQEVERYELREQPNYRFAANRREFVQVLGAGLMISVSARALSAQRRGDRERATKMSERFHIGADGTVTVLTGKVEVGQGSRTQITQAAAEELRLPLDRIRVIMADTELCPNDGGTAGSRTTPSTVPQVRMAAATVRDVLLGLASEKLSVERSSLTMKGGIFSDPVSNGRVTLAELAQDEGFASKLAETTPAGVSITRVDRWKVLGTTIPRVGGKDVVTGAAKYPCDIVRPKMLYGKILRPASFGATLKSVDITPARAMADVTVLHDGSFVGCAAKNSWQAEKAVDAIAATAVWDRPAQPSGDELFDHLKKTARTSGSGWPRPRVNTWGNREAGNAAATTTIDASYTVAYIQHAPMEPRAAVAEWTDEKLIAGWDFTNYNSGASAIDTPYKVPHGRTQFLASDSPLRQGSYRALASTANTFARESMMDELAHAAQTDPLEFRLAHLPDGRVRDVLLDAANQFKWSARRENEKNGHGIGLACGTEKGSYVAACAEVEVSRGQIKVLSICQTYECGAVQNPGNLRAQVEGCIIMGLAVRCMKKCNSRTALSPTIVSRSMRCLA